MSTSHPPLLLPGRGRLVGFGVLRMEWNRSDLESASTARLCLVCHVIAPQDEMCSKYTLGASLARSCLSTGQMNDLTLNEPTWIPKTKSMVSSSKHTKWCIGRAIQKFGIDGNASEEILLSKPGVVVLCGSRRDCSVC